MRTLITLRLRLGEKNHRYPIDALRRGCYIISSGLRNVEMSDDGTHSPFGRRLLRLAGGSGDSYSSSTQPQLSQVPPTRRYDPQAPQRKRPWPSLSLAAVNTPSRCSTILSPISAS